MTINKISGNILQDNLQRGANLSIQGNLLYVDIVNTRLGVNTSTPASTLDVNGNITAGNLGTTGVYATTVSAIGNVVANNVNSNSVFSTTISATANASAGNLTTVGIVSATGNITSGNVLTGGVVSATGNVTVGNLLTVGVVSATGNITGDYFIGNGRFLTGIDTTLISNGNSNVKVYANSNVTVTVAGIANVATFTAQGLDVVGNISAGNITSTSVTSLSDLNLIGTGNVVLVPDASNIVKIDSTNALLIPVGNTAQRPGTAISGEIRYNNSINQVEAYTGNSWTSLGSSPFAEITTQIITGDDSSVTFTLNQSTTASAIIVSTNGVMQIPDVAYTVSGNLITFPEPPLTSDVIAVRFTASVSTVNAITNTSGQQLIITTPGIVDTSNTHSLQLPIYSVAQATALGNVAAGQVIYVSNGNTGSPCLAVYDGSSWKRVIFGATISSS